MGFRPPSPRVLALLLPLLANASPLVTTTLEVEGTPVIIIDQVVATVTVHDGAATACAAGVGLTSGTAEIEVNDDGAGIGSGTATTVVNGGGNTFVSGPYATPTGTVPDATVLAPAIHPDVDPLDIVNIQLANSASLFYSDPNPASAGK